MRASSLRFIVVERKTHRGVELNELLGGIVDKTCIGGRTPLSDYIKSVLITMIVTLYAPKITPKLFPTLAGKYVKLGDL